ncbi:uncharacterized protein G2W53_035048 [Senna tora]|uniref:Uncharacterized protein n=1 Tax=Senna tora TaxID=362788 RepID=A0A834SSU8_9FABA|nr:uncharacterized protein G2W53_035048 [Senna tora]
MQPLSPASYSDDDSGGDGGSGPTFLACSASRTFCYVSGQRVNQEKTMVFFSKNVAKNKVDQLCSTLGYSAAMIATGSHQTRVGSSSMWMARDGTLTETFAVVVFLETTKLVGSTVSQEEWEKSWVFFGA